MVLPQLWDQVVGYKPNRPRQSVQHDGHKRLHISWYVTDTRGKNNETKDGVLSTKQCIKARNKWEPHLKREEHGARCDGKG